ncbi:MAG: cytochrome c biogenesis protein CcsA [Cystobacterineae bacterium]|nr:cytochrome c biogenesis protein CcsA [Cystobacterineae bacterium]
MLRMLVWMWAFLSILLVAIGAWLGLSWAPSEKYMGEVQRIMYVHVPFVQVALLLLVANFIACLGYLFSGRWGFDALAQATVEVGLLFGSVGVVLGAIWAKPTWGVYWTWDPRLTASAVLLIVYYGYWALRQFTEEPERRARWSAVVGILAAVNAPIVYFSVTWWRSMHQTFTGKLDIEGPMRFVWHYNSVAFLCTAALLVVLRTHFALKQRGLEVAMPPPPPPLSPKLPPSVPKPSPTTPHPGPEGL